MIILLINNKVKKMINSTFSSKVMSILDKKDSFGRTIKFPRMKKGLYYIIGYNIYEYVKILDDIAYFNEYPSNKQVFFTRRQLNTNFPKSIGKPKDKQNKNEYGSYDVFIKDGIETPIGVIIDELRRGYLLRTANN
jgi:hypothetical protein